ncbi:MAG TPA: SpoIIE family protein phosphatase [Micromonosporaceae bacterium]
MTEADLTDLLDEALLLTTELSTNSVVHAGTELDVQVVADAAGVTVTVSDFDADSYRLLAATPRPRRPAQANARGGAVGGSDVATGEIPAAPVELTERGRGLMLVDHFATSWGTTHFSSGKRVWFRLARPGDGGGDGGGTDHSGVEDAAPEPAQLSAAALTTFAELDRWAVEHGAGTLATDLLRRLCGILGCSGGMVLLDQGDGHGIRDVASYGVPPGDSDPTLRVPLPLNRPWRGELRIAAISPENPFASPLATLAAERLALVLENDRLRHTDLKRQGWLTFLAEASALLAQSLDVDLTLALIPQLVVPRLGPWCAVHAADEWGELRLASATHLDEAATGDLVKQLEREEPRAKLRGTLRSGQRASLAGPVEGLVLPLAARGQRLGTLTVGRHADRRQDSEEIFIIEDLAGRAALALDNARIHAERRRVAVTLQQSLLPPTLPSVNWVRFAAEYEPTGVDADVGGDFYDVLPLPRDRWLMVLGDVSGKGVAAAAVTGLVRDVIRVLARDDRPLPDLLTRVNEALIERGNGRYCTLVLASLTPGPGSRVHVRLHLAGHERPVLVAATGRASPVGNPGTALGLLDRVKSPPEDLILYPGDTLVFFTDGVTERRRGAEMFGVDRLRTALAGLAGLPAEAVAARLRSAVLGFSPEEPRDDIAIVVARNELLPGPG